MIAHEAVCIGATEYIVRFNDSRLRPVDVSCRRGQQFKDLLRVAILERLDRMSVLCAGKPHQAEFRA